MMDTSVQLICLAPSLVITSVKKHGNGNCNPFHLSPHTNSTSANAEERRAAPHQLVSWLLELLFYSSDRGLALDVSTSQRFLSYVETPHELSIVFEDALLSIFPDKTLEFEPIRWKALQVASAGAGAFLNQLSTLTELTTQLARNQISVFQISTYQTDFILVKIEDLDRAIHCLRSFCDVEMDDGEPFTPSSSFVSTATDTMELHLDPVKEVTLVHQHTLSVPDKMDLYLVQIDKSCVQRHMYALVRLLFGQSSSSSRASSTTTQQEEPTASSGAPENDGQLFLSYSETGNDISVVTSDLAFVDQIQQLAYRGEPGVMVSPDCWKVVQIGDKNLGFSETGIVAGHTRVLLNAGTMVFYLSTYATDFMLIKEDEWDHALQVLHHHFRVVQGRFMPLTTGDGNDTLRAL